MTRKTLRKCCALALSVMMLTGTAALGTNVLLHTAPTVSAAEIFTEGDYSYEETEDGITIVQYHNTLNAEGTVRIPGTIHGKPVTRIGREAFAYSLNVNTFSIPDTVTEIGTEAFYGCSNLSQVTGAGNVELIGKNAFQSTKLANQTGAVYIGKVLYSYNSVNPFRLTVKSGTKGIAPGALRSNNKVTYVTIPDSVSYIGADAFNNAGSLTGVTIGKGVTTIGDNAFLGCQKLTTVNGGENVTAIGYGSFMTCPKLNNTDKLFNKLETIDGCAFYGCEALVYQLPDTLKSIGYHAFQSCYSTTEVVIPDSVTELGEGVFTKCYKNLSSVGLTSVTIGKQIKKIDSKLFDQCCLLSSVVIPPSVKEIDEGAFDSVGTLYSYPVKTLTIYCVKGSYADTWVKNHPSTSYTTLKRVYIAANQSTLSASYVKKGGSVTVNCKATGGAEAYTYAVYYKKAGASKWNLAQKYSTNRTVSVKPAYSGNYIIRVNAKDAKGAVVKKDLTVGVFTNLKNTSSVSTPFLTLGNSVAVTAASTGGLGTKQYAVWYRNPNNKKWYKAQDYSANTTVTVKPRQTGDYVIRINVKDERGVIVKKDFTVTVTK